MTEILVRRFRGVRDGRSAPLTGDDNSGCTAGWTLVTGAYLMEVPEIRGVSGMCLSVGGHLHLRDTT